MIKKNLLKISLMWRLLHFLYFLCSVTGAAFGIFTIALLHFALRTCRLPEELCHIPGRYPDKFSAVRRVFSFNMKSLCAGGISLVVLLVCYFKCVVESGNNVGVLFKCVLVSESVWAKVELSVPVIIPGFSLFYCSFFTKNNCVYKVQPGNDV